MENKILNGIRYAIRKICPIEDVRYNPHDRGRYSAKQSKKDNQKGAPDPNNIEYVLNKLNNGAKVPNNTLCDPHCVEDVAKKGTIIDYYA